MSTSGRAPSPPPPHQAEIAKSIGQLNATLAEQTSALRQAHETIAAKDKTIAAKDETIAGLYREIGGYVKELGQRSDATLERQMRLEDQQSKNRIAEQSAQQRTMTVKAITGAAGMLAASGKPGADSEVVQVCKEAFMHLSPEARQLALRDLGEERMGRLLTVLGF